MVCEVLYNSVMKELLDTVGERKNQWMDWSFGVCGCVSVCETICQCVGVSMYVRVFCQCVGVSVQVYVRVFCQCVGVSGCFVSVWVCQCRCMSGCFVSVWVCRGILSVCGCVNVCQTVCSVWVCRCMYVSVFCQCVGVSVHLRVCQCVGVSVYVCQGVLSVCGCGGGGCGVIGWIGKLMCGCM